MIEQSLNDPAGPKAAPPWQRTGAASQASSFVSLVELFHRFTDSACWEIPYLGLKWW